MIKVLVFALVAVPALALADLNWGYMSENDKKMCVEGFGPFQKNEYCMALDCFGANSDNIVSKKLDFLGAGFQVSELVYQSNGRCYFQYWR